MKYLNNKLYDEFETMLNNLPVEKDTRIGYNVDNANRNKMCNDKFEQLMELNK